LAKLALHATTLFLAALLLFAVQPLAGRLLLPRLGGAPSVWATCLVFFQACLLAGYAYAHGLVRRLPLAAQLVVHGALLAAAIALAPRGAPPAGEPPAGVFPPIWLLGVLARWVGLPLVVLGATSPLVQHWFGLSRHRAARDPYFLYGASNLGSLAGLWGYPLLVEPFMRLGEEVVWWTWGLGALALSELLCATTLLGQRRVPESAAPPTEFAPQSSIPTAVDRLRWVAWAMVPTLLLQGVTTFVTTDLAPVPLLWVLPLGLYLITYVLAFARMPLVPHERVKRWAPLAVLLLGFALVTGLGHPLGVVLVAHFSAFFVLCWACHGELAARRPPLAHLTGFYLSISAGGVLGGTCGALVAPLVFRSLLEYPLAVLAVAALFAWAAGPDQALTDWREVAEDRQPASLATRAVRAARQPVIVGLLGCAAVVITRSIEPPWSFFLAGPLAMVACVIAYSLCETRQRAFALASGALLLLPFLLPSGQSVLCESRTFFGTHRVVLDRPSERHLYTQGTTIHGLQSQAPGRERVAGAYFHATGPAGEILGRIRPRRVGLVGLGVGSLAAYAEAGQRFDFYEIDKEVARIAEDARLFTFLSDARRRGAEVRVMIADGRLGLAQAPAGSFDLLVLDAYASDVVPTHLLTREAFALYRDRLAPGGFMLLNISNRYLDLGRVVGVVVNSLGLVAKACLDILDTPEQHLLLARDGKAVSRWIIIGRTNGDFAPLGLGERWKRLEATRGSPWTDDYVNIAGALAW
jgi:hypothetical protein